MHEIKAFLISSSFSTWVIIGLIWIFPFMHQSAILGTLVQPRAPAKPARLRLRSITSGTETDRWRSACWLQRRRDDRGAVAGAWRITVVLPMRSKV